MRFLKRLIYASVVLYIAAFALIWYARISLIYPFTINPTHQTPAQAGAPRLLEKMLTTKDGNTLVLWVKPARASKATVLYFHGNAGSLSGRAQRFNRLINRGYGVVAMAYRGSSGSTGQPSEEAITKDSLLLRNSLSQVLGKEPKGKIIYYGESLGTGVATKLATTIPPDALILEAPYTSVVNLAAKSMPIFPIRAVLDQRWETETHIKQVKSSTLILHGTDDQVIPYAHGKAIFALSPAPNKQMKTLKGGHHLSGFSVSGQKAIYRFIEGL